MSYLCVGVRNLFKWLKYIKQWNFQWLKCILNSENLNYLLVERPSHPISPCMYTHWSPLPPPPHPPPPLLCGHSHSLNIFQSSIRPHSVYVLRPPEYGSSRDTWDCLFPPDERSSRATWPTEVKGQLPGYPVPSVCCEHLGPTWTYDVYYCH